MKSFTPDLVCFSHLRWDFVYQRPQHLMSRAAAGRRVFFIEEAKPTALPAHLDVRQAQENLWVATPMLDPVLLGEPRNEIKRALLARFFRDYGIEEFMSWYYTPAALSFTRHLQPQTIVYDCMDELSAFRGAPKSLRDLEDELYGCATVVFTGGESLYESKRTRHRNVHLFPSSIDAAHFGQARQGLPEPADQASIARPRLGYFGVIDERIDLDLIAAIAQLRPEWQIVLIGPFAKLEAEQVPRAPSIHYLGMRSYAELPAYLGGWDVALMPFALNEATRYISPTKTPEYLAGGVPVASTPIRDVVRPYGELGLVRIASSPEDFVAAIEAALAEPRHDPAWLGRVDAFLARTSWDETWRKMDELIRSGGDKRV